MLCYTILYYVVKQIIILYYTIPYHIILYYIILYRMRLHYGRIIGHGYLYSANMRFEVSENGVNPHMWPSSVWNDDSPVDLVISIFKQTKI